MKPLADRLLLFGFLAAVGGALALSQVYGLIRYPISDALWARRQKAKLE